MSYVLIFHLTVPAVWISVLLAAAVASILTRFVLREKTGEWYWNAVSLYILTWKISYIPFNFENFVDMPSSIIYFNGGLSGHVLGVALVIIYLFRAQKKNIAVAKQYVFSWLLFFLSYQAILQGFESHVTEAILHSTLLLVSVFSIRLLVNRADVPTSLLLAVLFTLELLILSVFYPLPSWQNGTYILPAVITTILYNRFEQKGTSL